MSKSLTDRRIGVLVEQRGVGVRPRRSSSDHLPPIGGEFVSTRSGLALRNGLELTSHLDSALGDEVESVEGLVEVAREDELEVTGTISKGDESHLRLLTETVDPTEDSDTLVTVLGEVSDLDLQVWQG